MISTHLGLVPYFLSWQLSYSNSRGLLLKALHKSIYTICYDSKLGGHPGQENTNLRSRNVGTTITRHTYLPPLPFFCRSSSPSIRRLSISSISLMDSRMSSANLQRSWSLRALNVIRVQLSTRCESLIPNE